MNLTHFKLMALFLTGNYEEDNFFFKTKRATITDEVLWKLMESLQSMIRNHALFTVIQV